MLGYNVVQFYSDSLRRGGRREEYYSLNIQSMIFSLKREQQMMNEPEIDRA